MAIIRAATKEFLGFKYTLIAFPLLANIVHNYQYGLMTGQLFKATCVFVTIYAVYDIYKYIYLIKGRQWSYSDSSTKSALLGSTIHDAEGSNLKVSNRMEDGNVEVFDAAYENTFYYNKSAYVYSHDFYTVAYIKLVRKVPHIILDSSKHRGPQLRRKFVGKQIQDLKFNLNDNFTVYVPSGYNVDVMSFITPEVVEILSSLNECDVEFIGSSLYIFTYAKRDRGRLDIYARTKMLDKKLNDHLASYKDQRLEPIESSQRVAVLGQKLIKSTSTRAAQAALVSFAAIITYAEGLNKSRFEGLPEYILIGTTLLVVSCFAWAHVYKTQQLNRKIMSGK